MDTQPLSQREICSHLGSVRTVGREIICLSTVDSTNAYLKRLAADGAADGTVAAADEQTAGRGRRGRSFQSAAGKGVYLSTLLRPQLAPGALLPLTGLCAVAMCAAVERACGVRPQIKWTNDLILHKRKLGGILTEVCVEQGRVPYAVVGIGVNVGQKKEDFAGEVADMATSLECEMGRPVSRNALAAAMIEQLDALYSALQTGEMADYLAAYRCGCVTLGQDVQILWQDAKETVRALDVDEQFGLIVEHADGRKETVRTGEVSVRGLYGYAE